MKKMKIDPEMYKNLSEMMAVIKPREILYIRDHYLCKSFCPEDIGYFVVEKEVLRFTISDGFLVEQQPPEYKTTYADWDTDHGPRQMEKIILYTAIRSVDGVDGAHRFVIQPEDGWNVSFDEYSTRERAEAAAAHAAMWLLRRNYGRQ